MTTGGASENRGACAPSLSGAKAGAASAHEAHEPAGDDLRREELTMRAERLRGRLALTLGELDRRRHQLTDKLHVAELKARLTRTGVPVEFLAGAAAGVAITGLIVATVRAIDRRRHPYRERWRALVRAWQHPERIAP